MRAMPKPKKATSPEFEAFVAEYLTAHADVARGSLFGMPSLKLGRKAFAGSYDGGLVVKLGDDIDAALSIEGATAFDPSGKGRPMKGWAVLPTSARARWQELADRARAQLGG